MSCQPLRPYFKQLETLTNSLNVLDAKRLKVLDFFRDSPMLCFMKNSLTGVYEFVNEAMVKEMGKTSHEEIIGNTDNKLFPERIAEVSVLNDLKLLRQKTPQMAIRVADFGSGRKVYLVVKFLIVNGEESIGGAAIELPDTFSLRFPPGEECKTTNL